MHIVSHPRNGNMSSIYTLVPRPINDFARLDLVARYAFGLIWDRWQLSGKKENRGRFTDQRGLFCYYERRAMAAEIGVTLPTVRKAINALEDAGLIMYAHDGLGAPWKYYITERGRDNMECGGIDVWYPADEDYLIPKPAKG